MDECFSIELLDHNDDVVVLGMRGELDLATVPLLRSALADHDGAAVVVDLAQTTFVDSTGIGLLVAAYNRAEQNGSSFRVSNVVHAAPRRTLEIAGVYEMLTGGSHHT